MKRPPPIIYPLPNPSIVDHDYTSIKQQSSLQSNQHVNTLTCTTTKTSQHQTK